MSVPVRRRRTAHDELLACVDTIADASPDSAIRFIDAFERLCAHLSQHPEMAPLYQSEDPSLTGLRIRRRPIGKEFPNYVVFYAFDGEAGFEP